MLTAALALACEADGVSPRAVAATGRGRCSPGRVGVKRQLEEKSKHLICRQVVLSIYTSKHFQPVSDLSHCAFQMIMFAGQISDCGIAG